MLVVATLVAVAIFVTGLGLIALMPVGVADALEVVPVKLLLVEIDLMATIITFISVFWLWHRPRMAGVALGWSRMCYFGAVGALATPPAIFSFEKLSLFAGHTLLVDISFQDSMWPASLSVVIFLLFGRFFYHDYRDARLLEFDRGLATYI